MNQATPGDGCEPPGASSSAPEMPTGFWTAFWAVFHEALEADHESPCTVISTIDQRVRFNPGTAIEVAAALYGERPEALLRRHGGRELTEARALAVWAMRRLGGGWSYPAIARALGGRDHTTIQYLHRQALYLAERSERFRGACEDLTRRFAMETSE